METQTNTLEAISENINAQKATLTALNKQRNAMLDALYSSQFRDKIEAISKIINAQIAKLKELNKQRNAMLDALYTSQFAHKVEVLEYFEMFEVQYERRVTVYYNDVRLLNELRYNKTDGYYTQSALHYIVNAYNAKMIAHTEITTLYNI